MPVKDANMIKYYTIHCQYFLKHRPPVDNDKECHDNIELSSMFVLFENRHTAVHLFAVVSLQTLMRNKYVHWLFLRNEYVCWFPCLLTNLSFFVVVFSS